MRRRINPLVLAVFGITFAILPGGFDLAADDHPSTPPAKRDDHGQSAPTTKPALPHLEHPAPRLSDRKPATAARPAPAAASRTPEPAANDSMDADAALELLREGNARWTSGSCAAPNTDPGRRESVAENGQHPFVTVLTCADSRLPVERMFDRGVGDIFVVRVAGAVAGDAEVGTVEYGVEHLKTPLPSIAVIESAVAKRAGVRFAPPVAPTWSPPVRRQRGIFAESRR